VVSVSTILSLIGTLLVVDVLRDFDAKTYRVISVSVERNGTKIVATQMPAISSLVHSLTSRNTDNTANIKKEDYNGSK
jgi:hypothetical protein